jgi:hypothetical protein
VFKRDFVPLQKNSSPSPLKERGIKGVRCRKFKDDIFVLPLLIMGVV